MKYTLCLMSYRTSYHFNHPKPSYEIQRRWRFEAANDEAAIAIAEQRLTDRNGFAALWHFNRRMQHIELRHGHKQPRGCITLSPPTRQEPSVLPRMVNVREPLGIVNDDLPAVVVYPHELPNRNARHR